MQILQSIWDKADVHEHIQGWRKVLGIGQAKPMSLLGGSGSMPQKIFKKSML